MSFLVLLSLCAFGVGALNRQEQTLFSKSYAMQKSLDLRASATNYGDGASGANYGASAQKYGDKFGGQGASGYRSSEGYGKGLQGSFGLQINGGHYGLRGGALKSFGEHGAFHGLSEGSNAGQKGSNHKTISSYKKGGSSKGFQRFHHLEEKGREESYYDERHEEGSQEKYGDQHKSYKEEEGKRYGGEYEDRGKEEKEYGKEGEYKKGAYYEDEEGKKTEDGQKTYFDKQGGYSDSSTVGDFGVGYYEIPNIYKSFG